MHRSQSGKLRRAAVTAGPSALSTGVRPFRVQRDEEVGPSAKAEDDSAGMLDSYLSKRQIARTVPPAGAWSADEGTIQTKPVDGVGTVQREAAQAMHQEAAAGVQGSGAPLPHLAEVQRAFGRHDVSGLQTFRNGQAATAAGRLGTPAYTAAGRIAFRDSAPSLQTVAHEAAHAVQQRHGLDLGDGIGRRGDAHEQHAEAVARKVVAGESAEAELDRAATGPAAPAGPALQGLTGFEVELHEPIYTTPGDARKPTVLKKKNKVTPAIEAFLGGGLKYGRRYGFDPLLRYTLTADHGGVRALHSNLIEALQADGYIDPDWKYVTMTNLEYITPPIEEREAGSHTRTQGIIDAVDKHVAATEVEAKKDGVNPVPAPALDLLTGIPKSALRAWIDEGDAASMEALEALEGYEGYVYHQVTTGVLPSEIPELFEQAATEIQFGPLDEVKIDVTTKLLRESIRIAQETVTASTEQLVGIASTEPIRGWLTLVAQYLLASKLEDTTGIPGGTAKNNVAYLSKTDLSESIQALPEDSRPEKTQKWIAVLKVLLEKVKVVDVLTWAEGLEERKSKDEVIAGGNWGAFFKALLEHTPAPTIKSGNPLKLDAGQENQKPDLTIPGQQAIPLEDRFAIGKSHDAKEPAKIKKTLRKEFDKALERRFASAGKSDIDLFGDMLDDKGAYAKLTPEQLLADLLARLKKWRNGVKTLKALPEKDLEEKSNEILGHYAKAQAGIKPGAEKSVVEEGKTSFTKLEEIALELHGLMSAKLQEVNKTYVEKVPELTEEGGYV
jgi:hypothetical protein